MDDGTVIIGDSPVKYTTRKIWAQPLRVTNPKINSPHGFGLDKDGKVMMTDEGGSRVLRFTKDGKYLDEIRNVSGESPGQFREPREVRADSAGNIYMTDAKGDRLRIKVFSHEGKLIYLQKKEGDLVRL